MDTIDGLEKLHDLIENPGQSNIFLTYAYSSVSLYIFRFYALRALDLCSSRTFCTFLGRVQREMMMGHACGVKRARALTSNFGE